MPIVYYIKCTMNFKNMYSWSIGGCVGVLAGCWIVLLGLLRGNRVSQAVTGDDVSVCVDTVYVSDANFHDVITRGAAGVFLPSQNRIWIHYMKPVTKETSIVHLCDINNQNIQLSTRHEIEHARKAGITKNTAGYPGYIRGQIAAMNEIMARGGEIIEAVDYRLKNGCAFPAVSAFVRRADAEIAGVIGDDKNVWSDRFDSQPVADIVLKYATMGFMKELNRGHYKTTIRHALIDGTVNKNKHSYAYSGVFVPQIGLWNGLWCYETMGGRVDVWAAASADARARVLRNINDAICRSYPGYLLLDKKR